MMEIAKIKVSGATASAEKESKITAGMVGVTVRMQYADIWDGLHKTVVFRAGTVTKDVITDDEVVTVPKEVVAAKDVYLQVGVYGVDAEGNLVIPTIWAGIGRVMDAADPSGDAETDASLPAWVKIMADAENAVAVAQSVRDDADRGAFDGKPGKPGNHGITPTVGENGNWYIGDTDTGKPSRGGPGKDGATPTIGDNGNWYLGNIDTGKPSRGEPGQPGADAAPGPVGATPNIQIGTVETLTAGSSATASMGGTPENPILNLGIPQGAPGSGEGGSGIAVTGATVGQTVRIAAVDDDGVPTAWEPVDFPKGGHWETIYEYVSDNIVVTDFSITYDEENKYSILTVPDGVLSEFNVGDHVILGIFPLDETSKISNSYITGKEYDIEKNKAVILSAVEIRIQHNNDRSDITPSNAVIEIMHRDIPKIFGDTIAFNPTSKLRYTGINTGGDISSYTTSLFYGLRYMGKRTAGYINMRTKHMNLIANLEVANGLLLFHHTVSVDMLSSTSGYNNKWTDLDVVGYIDAPTSYMTDGKLTSIVLGSNYGTPMFPRKGGFIRLEGWYE